MYERLNVSGGRLEQLIRNLGVPNLKSIFLLHGQLNLLTSILIESAPWVLCGLVIKKISDTSLDTYLFGSDLLVMLLLKSAIKWCQEFFYLFFFFFEVRSVLFNPLSASVALIKTSQLICCANQLTGFYMRATLALNGLLSDGNNI